MHNNLFLEKSTYKLNIGLIGIKTNCLTYNFLPYVPWFDFKK